MKRSSLSLENKNRQNQRAPAFLRALLAEVPFDGWTASAFKAASRATGISEAEAVDLFPGGIRSCVLYFAREADTFAVHRAEKSSTFKTTRTRDKIFFLVKARLEYLAPHREAYRRLLVWCALPGHWRLSAQIAAETADQLWRAAGDVATDHNFYTKRGLLSGVIQATTLFWLEDESLNDEKTWEFLGRRVENVMQLGKFLGSSVPTVLESLRKKLFAS